MNSKTPENLREFKSLVQVIEALRGPDGCPWDKKQTHASLTRFAIEEAHELAEAIQNENIEEIKSELGDLLLQVVLHSEIARQENHFEIADVIETLNEKMIRRHPHVFADVSVKDADEVIQNWEQIKLQEKVKKNKDRFQFDLPKSLPALIASFKIGEKTKKYNFDWPDVTPVIEKVEEEIAELKTAIANNDAINSEEELGDILFSVAQLARHLNIDPEHALRKTNAKFERRFSWMFESARSSNSELQDFTAEQLEELWSKAKKATEPT